MSFKKVTLASLILLSLTACSSGGSGQGGNNESKMLSDTKLELNKANDKKAKLEKSLDEVNTKLANTNKELEKAKNDQSKSDSELQKIKAELARLQQEKDGLVKDLNKADQDNKTNKEKLLDANKTKTNLENELDELKSELNYVTKEKATLSSKLNTANQNLETATQNLKNLEQNKQATEEQLDEARAELADLQTKKQEVENQLSNKTRIIDQINKKLTETIEFIGNGDNFRLRRFDQELSLGFHQRPFILLSKENDDGIMAGDYYIYVQPNSTIHSRNHIASTRYNDLNGSFRISDIEGQMTNNLPELGSAIYIGKAFNAGNVGELTYNVNFSDKTGSGNITGFQKLPDIELKQGKIQSSMIKADAALADGTRGKYELGFYGSNAEDIAGELYIYKHLENGVRTNESTAEKYNDSERGTAFGLGGTRGEITE